jgi:charged multivesicular body protein 4
MSFLKKVFRLFGKDKSKAKQTSTKSSPEEAIRKLNDTEAIRKLNDTEEVLLEQQRVWEKKMEQELAVAQKNAKTNRRRAQQALRRKNHYAHQLHQNEGTLARVRQQREALESALMNSIVLDSLGLSAHALKKAQGNITADQINDVMDDIDEEQRRAREIQEALSNPQDSLFDEEELEAELQELLDQDQLGNLSDNLSKLPEVPSYLPLADVESDQLESVLC